MIRYESGIGFEILISSLGSTDKPFVGGSYELFEKAEEMRDAILIDHTYLLDCLARFIRISVPCKILEISREHIDKWLPYRRMKCRAGRIWTEYWRIVHRYCDVDCETYYHDGTVHTISGCKCETEADLYALW